MMTSTSSSTSASRLEGLSSSSVGSEAEFDSDEENELGATANGGDILSDEVDCDKSSPRKVLKNSNSANTPSLNKENDNLNLCHEPDMDILNDKFSFSSVIDTDIENGRINTPVAQDNTLNENHVNYGKKRPLPVQNLSAFRELHDLTKLDCITLENVLECLRERYRSHQYYTYAGPILLSLNSCLRLSRSSLIEDVARMSSYFVNNNEKNAISEEEENVPPHVYDIGKRCLKNLMNVGSDQVVLISGETGAGKTTATQQLIKYLTENNSRNFGANFCSNLDKKIYFATVILESFGNAKTQANPNSSRFGRLVQLNYCKSTGKISGAEIQTYLLEKHRVAKYDARYERSFHIFYYILHCLRNGKIEVPNLTWKTIKCVTLEHMVAEAADCEDDEVQRLQNAVLAFNMDDFSEVVNMLFAIISLLSVIFVPDCDSSSEEEHYSSSLESPHKTEFTVGNRSCASLAAELLSVKENELVDILIARKITAGSSHRHSIFRKPCERAAECEERLHALTSFIYDRIFAYVLDHLNTNLKGDVGQVADELCTFSLLDLYGFENFKTNHLEQICINYANERLQQINVSIVKSYYEQSIPPDEVMIPPTELIRIEKELCTRIDELHLHVFSFLDEECLLKRMSEDGDVLERMRLNLSNKKSSFIQTFKPHEKKYKFTVTHYATPVDYKLEGLIQKNKDHIPPEFQDILKSSKNSFIQSLFQEDLVRSRNASGRSQKSKFTVTSNKNTRGKTILTRFKASVDELMSRLKTGENKDVHFIRCIRPNADLQAGFFSMNVVEKQLHTCGIADVVKIAGNGFPIRFNSSKLPKEFPKIITYFCNGNSEPKLLSLVFSGSISQSSLKFGKTMVFMSEKCWKTFKKTEKFLALHNVKIIQKAWKRYQEQKEAIKWSLSHSAEIELSQDYTCATCTDPESDLDVSRSTASPKECMDSSNTLCNDSSEKDTSRGSTTTLVAVKIREKQSEFIRPSLYYGDGIVSRVPLHSLPIKIYTKRTCLLFAEKAPRRLLANGIQDAFEDYGIIFYKS